ncbi:DUF934 domain-containing protein [Pelagerythrobacter rhizovicinus]|uniref:DUF934 domain-containing protein n=1 Tax=Pelagerythrobacter rhizovicinus TaxID=2268576 RepID=A0A4Q2KI73_9SPHN|nr:DUF934 domain-containing protein [Pelagerythrobacter rhizovicinus]RXZ64019.1 DUF934 domain-containing protein [Pelagerythrobacter rhizovicinus]
MADSPSAGGPGGGPGTLEPTPGGERDWLRFRDDSAPDEPAVSLDAFLDQSNAGSVRIEAGDDVRHLAPHLERLRLVEIDFPKFRDGRGFSSARVLREMGYDGEIKATGEVLVDLIYFMRRCGFDSFAPDVPLDRADVESVLNRYPHVYQHAADGAVPIWQLRHG